MSEKPKKACPLRIGDQLIVMSDDCQCLEDDCAWWFKFDFDEAPGRCAVRRLAEALDKLGEIPVGE